MVRSRFLRNIYIAILVMLALITVVNYWNQKNYSEEVKWVRYSNDILRVFESLLSLVKDAETGHRGFQLSRDTTYLAPYYRSVKPIEANLRRLDSLILDKELRKTNDSLRKLIGKQFAIIRSILTKESMKMNNAGKSETDSIADFRMDSVSISLLGEGKKNMDKIRLIVSYMKKNEEEILDQRLSKAKRFSTITPVALLTYAFIALGGASFLFMLLMRELTQRKKAEKDLRTYTEDLKRSNDDLEQFAYVASHDLQEPLRKIRAFGDRLQTKYAGDLDVTGMMYIERMQDAAHRMQNLIEDLLSFSRISKEHDLHVHIDLNQIVGEVLEDLCATIEESGATFEIAQLPEINGSKSQLKRLFQNLIGNAIKFKMPGRNPHITITALKVKREIPPAKPGFQRELLEYHRISIKDNGIGFDQKYAHRIFTIFQRLHGRSMYEGTGMGLAISRRIVDNHDGFITAKGVEDEGAEFAIFFKCHV